MAFIEYLLENFNDSHAFELLCSQVMYKEGYSQINPIGGPNDHGVDAEDILYQGVEGKRTIIFQFSTEKNITSKVNKTLKRLKETIIGPNEVIFVFSTEPKAGERDRLKEKSLREYGLNINIFGLRYLAIRLGSNNYRDVVSRFFGTEISQMKDLYESGVLFAPDSGVPDKEQRCLINLMNYTRNPMAGDIKTQIIRQAIRGSLVRCQDDSVSRENILQMVYDYLPLKCVPNKTVVDKEIEALTSLGELEVTEKGYGLNKELQQTVELNIANIVAGRRALVDTIYKECGINKSSSIESRRILKGIDDFFCNVFRKHGLEVAHAILDTEGTLETALDPDSMDAILSQIVSSWAPETANRFRSSIKLLMSRPMGGALEYMSALSSSYICMQLINVDPDSINIQKQRTKESVAVFDTDVILTGIVRGTRRERISKTVMEMCQKHGMECFVFTGSIEEIVFRIKKSITLYEDLGCPSIIPPDKKTLISDIFLDVYFENLATGKVRSFDEFIKEYYDLVSPEEYIKQQIEDKLGIPVAQAERYYIIPQEDKINRLKATIEKSRVQALSFKNPIMYFRDALAMVVVEQQNRQMIGAKKLGRWYLVSEDRHILNAYLQNKNSFKVKPSILPVYFLELLRQCPEGGADEETFGAILESEAMLHGVGRNYAPIIGALTRLGIEALYLPSERLLELIDIMDRADFTQWLIKMHSETEMPDPIKEEVREALEKMVQESRSRTETIERLKEIQMRSK